MTKQLWKNNYSSLLSWWPTITQLVSLSCRLSHKLSCPNKNTQIESKLVIVKIKHFAPTIKHNRRIIIKQEAKQWRPEGSQMMISFSLRVSFDSIVDINRRRRWSWTMSGHAILMLQPSIWKCCRYVMCQFYRYRRWWADNLVNLHTLLLFDLWLG